LTYAKWLKETFRQFHDHLGTYKMAKRILIISQFLNQLSRIKSDRVVLETMEFQFFFKLCVSTDVTGLFCLILSAWISLAHQAQQEPDSGLNFPESRPHTDQGEGGGGRRRRGGWGGSAEHWA
jgi:hypothetical protein